MEAVGRLGRALTGKKGYNEGLLGDSLPELLRRATAKELLIPDVAVNQQVVNTIQEEVSLGKDTREIVALLKKRLRADKPQKQWLAVILLQKVLNDCSNVLGAHTEELLQEVARVMTRPAKPDTEAGKRARHAAKDLLRSFGRAGTSAFRYANNDMFPRNQIGRFGGFGNTYPAVGGGYPGAYGASPTRGGYNAFANPGYAAGPGSPNSRAHQTAMERETIMNEVTLLIDKSRSNSELLSDMLVNSGGQGADEFENDLIKDLMKEVNELRSVFPAYLEQLQVLAGPDMEQLTMNALQASDALDSAVTLQKDVIDNKQLPQEPAPAPANGAAPSAQQQQAPAPVPAAAPGPAPAAPATTAGDLIGFDDISNPTPPPPAAAAHDPFAASTYVPPMAPPVGGAPPMGGPPPMKSAFESMYTSPQQNPQMAYSAASVAAAAPLTEQQLQQQREEAARQQAAAQEEARKAQAMAQQAQLTAQQQIEMQAQQKQAQEEAQAHARYQQQLLQWQAHQASLGLSTNPGLNTDMPVLDPITNPFFDPLAEGGLLRAPAAASSTTYATPPPQPPPPMSANNPFAPQQQPMPQPAQQQQMPTPPQPQSTVDAEWDMFFADRSAGVQQQQQQQQQQQATGL